VLSYGGCTSNSIDAIENKKITEERPYFIRDGLVL
jgi:hypothetical protein